MAFVAPVDTKTISVLTLVNNSMAMNIPTHDYRRTTIKKAKPVPAGLDAYAYRCAGVWNRKKTFLTTLVEEAETIDRQSSVWHDKSDDALRGSLLQFKDAFRRNKRDFEVLLPQALGAIREASQRSLGLRPYNVQIAGALALYRGIWLKWPPEKGKRSLPR